MSDQPSEFNPYQPADGQPGQQPAPSLLGRKVAELARWQTFFAILMTIGIVGFLGLLAITMLAGSEPVAALGGIACMGGFMMLIYGLPAVTLWKASASARQYSRSPDSQQLEEFASAQLVFWRTVGIIAALVLGFYAVAIVVVMLVGVTAAVS